MELITWQNEYALGIEEIDKQHQKIVEIINRLYQLFSENKMTETGALQTILKELTDYADYHFTTEENYFANFKYPQAPGHIEKHNQYRAKVEEFKNQLAGDNIKDVFFTMTNFLHEWWIWHINNMDREYVSLFKENGVK